MSTATLITADEFMKMDLDGRYELVQGELVEMSQSDPVHGFICMTVGALLLQWAEEHNAGRVGSNDGAVQTKANPDTVRGADLYFFSNDRLPRSATRRGPQAVPPDLIVEVLSPNNRWQEILQKVGEYLAVGVDEVWVLDSDGRTCQVFRGDTEPAKYIDSDTIESRVLPGFSAQVGAFFKNA